MTSNMSRRRKTALEDGSDDYLSKRLGLAEIAKQYFKAHGFKATTLAEIGHKAGMDRATVYYYSGSKEELFRECLRVGEDANVAACEQVLEDPNRYPANKLWGIMQKFMSAYDQYYPHMQMYIQE